MTSIFFSSTFSPKPRFVFSTLIVSSLTLSGCGSISSDSTLDYKSTKPVSQRSLEVPPDLTPVARNERYSVADRNSAINANSANTASAASSTSATASATQPQLVKSGALAAATVALGAPNARIERAGSQRWLAVDVAPEQAFTVVHEFLPSVGLKIEREDATTGIVETEWAENRAKLPQDVIRRTLGRVLDSLYSTGEQDKYRIRIERTAANTSEIYISHRGMIEVYTSTAQESTRWQPRPADVSLEAEMLQRLLLRFAPAKTQTAAQTEPQPAVAVTAAPAAHVIEVNGESRVEINEPFDRAWRRVGVALDRGGFTVEDRDRAQGFYYVRYLDPEYEARQREKQGLFSKMFGREYKVEAQQFRVQVQTVNQATQVSVGDRNGKPDSSGTALKIIKQLNEQLK